MSISLEQAEAICSFVEEGTFQLASKRLNKSHTAIIYALKSLEEATNIKILDRSGYRTKLTPSGERIYAQCRELLNFSQRLDQLCLDLAAGWEPKIKIVYDGIMSPDPFLNLMKHFQNKNIPTTINIFSDFLAGVQKTYEETSADFMVSVIQPKRDSFFEKELPPITSHLVAHRDHSIFQQKKRWTLQELKRFTFLTVRGADRELNLGTKELEEHSTFHVSDFFFKKNAISKGGGFGWLPDYLIKKELRAGTFRKIFSEIESTKKIYPKLFYRKTLRMGNAGKIVLEEFLNRESQ